MSWRIYCINHTKIKIIYVKNYNRNRMGNLILCHQGSKRNINFPIKFDIIKYYKYYF